MISYQAQRLVVSIDMRGTQPYYYGALSRGRRARSWTCTDVITTMNLDLVKLGFWSVGPDLYYSNVATRREYYGVSIAFLLIE